MCCSVVINFPSEQPNGKQRQEKPHGFLTHQLLKAGIPLMDLHLVDLERAREYAEAVSAHDAEMERIQANFQTECLKARKRNWLLFAIFVLILISAGYCLHKILLPSMIFIAVMAIYLVEVRHNLLHDRGFNSANKKKRNTIRWAEMTYDEYENRYLVPNFVHANVQQVKAVAPSATIAIEYLFDRFFLRVTLDKPGGDRESAYINLWKENNPDHTLTE